MNDTEKAYQSTPDATLEQQIMDCRIPKNEREHWAAREIEKLRAALRAAPSTPPALAAKQGSQTEWAAVLDELIEKAISMAPIVINGVGPTVAENMRPLLEVFALQVKAASEGSSGKLNAPALVKPECMTQSEYDEAVGSAAHEATTPPAPASLAGEKEEIPRWAIHAASEVLWGPSGPMVPSDGLSIDEQIEMEKTAAIIAKHSFSAALPPCPDAVIEAADGLRNSLRAIMHTVETMDADERYAAREEGRSAHVNTSILKQSKQALDAYEEVITVLSGRNPDPLPPARPATDGKDGAIARFAGQILLRHREESGDDLGGDFVQETALKCGLLEQRTVTEPCGDNCTCAEVTDFPCKCYFVSKLGQSAIDDAMRGDGTGGLER